MPCLRNSTRCPAPGISPQWRPSPACPFLKRLPAFWPAPEEFYINYSKEATLGQELKLWGFRDGQEYRMEGIGPQGTCFTALCVFGEQ